MSPDSHSCTGGGDACGRCGSPKDPFGPTSTHIFLGILETGCSLSVSQLSRKVFGVCDWTSQDPLDPQGSKLFLEMNFFHDVFFFSFQSKTLILVGLWVLTGPVSTVDDTLEISWNIVTATSLKNPKKDMGRCGSDVGPMWVAD